MGKAGPLTLAATLAVALTLPQAAYAQGGKAEPTQAEKEAAKAPIPPGVPTNPSNVHLPTENEVKLGREGAREVEKYYDIINTGPYAERLARISRDVVTLISKKNIAEEYKRVYHLSGVEDNSKRVPFEWSFKVVQAKPRPNSTNPKPPKEINAFSLAGGYCYVTKDLMDAASDQELAAVLGHECSHVAFHHVSQLIKKEKKMSKQQIWGLLAAVLAGAAGGGQVAAAAAQVMVGAQLVSIATLTGYGRDLENEADRVAVIALAGSDYSPVAMLTFMRKLQREDQLRGYPTAGIFDSHPYTNERASLIQRQCEALGYKVDTASERQVSGAFRVTQEPVRVDGKPAVQLLLNGNLLFTVVAPENGLSPQERAQQIADRVERMFRDNLTYNDVRKSPDKTAVVLRGVTVIRVYPEDASTMGSAEAVADKACNEIVRALLKEQISKPQ
jgi:Zn-dependent protease with chaperone function